MPVDDAPEDDNQILRQTYNFAPGNHGLVYRAEAPPSEAGSEQDKDSTEDIAHPIDGASTKETKYKLQAMKWGLIPFWTKRAPDYGSQLKTINCRDDSLAQSGGMWNTMKQKKRCIIIAEGFYEWLKKNNGKEKIPHFVKRKDGQLMCFAGLWDCVKYDGQDESLYTYTIITTSSSKQLNFLHDRMPVILDNGSDQMKTWLDPARSSWSKELQTLLKPYDGQLECYPVDRAVGKVGNNSPSFIIPIDSKENKKNIANFFSSQRKDPKGAAEENFVKRDEDEVKKEPDENRETDTNLETTEDNAPLPKPQGESFEHLAGAIKSEFPDSQDLAEMNSPPMKETRKNHHPHDTDSKAPLSSDIAKGIKRDFPDSQDLADINSPPPAAKLQKTDHQEEQESKPHLKSPERAPSSSARKTRSAVSNGSADRTPSKSTGNGNRKITAFFAK